MTATDKQTHTPGPWNVGTGWIYAGDTPKGTKPICEGLPITPEGDANAQLIAAAPELLEACKGILAALSQNKTFLADIEYCKTTAQAAIANATN